MHRFSRMHLSPEAAVKALDAIDVEEKSRVAEGIALLAVIDRRGDYLAAGFSCMRNYCMHRLHWSEDRTLRRLQVARKALSFPDLFEYLADGRLSVTTAAVVAPHLTESNSARLLLAAAYKSRPEITHLVAQSFASDNPAISLLTSNVQESSESHAPVHATATPDLAMATTCIAGHAPEHATPVRRGRIVATVNGSYELRVTLTPEEHEALKQTQGLLGHAIPSGDLALVCARAMKYFFAHLAKQRFGAKPAAAPAHEAKGRGIPKPLRKLIWERDGGRCAFMSADGHRCGESFRVEIDHIQPLALGGRTVPENLRLLCPRTTSTRPSASWARITSRPDANSRGVHARGRRLPRRPTLFAPKHRPRNVIRQRRPGTTICARRCVASAFTTPKRAAARRSQT